MKLAQEFPMKPIARLSILSLIAFLLPVFPSAAATLLTIYQDDLYTLQQDIEIPASPVFRISGLPETVDPYSIVLTPAAKTVKIISWEIEESGSRQVTDPLVPLTNRHLDLIDSADHAFKGRLLRAYPDSILLTQDGSGQNFIISRKDIKAIQLSPDSVSCLTDTSLNSSFSIGLKLDAPKPGSLRIFYQARGISCTPLYRAFLDDKSGTLEFLNEFYLENNTSVNYTNAVLEYLEAEMARTPPSQPRTVTMKFAANAAEASAPEEIAAADIFEYTRYEVKARGGLTAFSKRHITHFRVDAVPFRKSYYYNPSQDREEGSVQTKISFTNAKAAGLGFTLPRGVVKIYSTEDGLIRLIGENAVERTMASDEVRLLPGSSRDIRVRRLPQDQKRVSDKITEQTVQFTVKNDKAETIQIEIEEPLYGVWEVRNSSDKYRKNGIQSISFILDVPPKSERVVTYAVWQR